MRFIQSSNAAEPRPRLSAIKNSTIVNICNGSSSIISVEYLKKQSRSPIQPRSFVSAVRLRCARQSFSVMIPLSVNMTVLTDSCFEDCGAASSIHLGVRRGGCWTSSLVQQSTASGQIILFSHVCVQACMCLRCDSEGCARTLGSFGSARPRLSQLLSGTTVEGASECLLGP